MPTNYELIYQAIDQEKAISATYQKDPDDAEERLLLPYILGRSEDSDTGVEEQVVLSYQFDGYSPGPLQTPHPHLANWRCFKVNMLEDVEIIDVSFDWDPFKMTGKHRKRQNCVEIRVIWRNP